MRHTTHFPGRFWTLIFGRRRFVSQNWTWEYMKPCPVLPCFQISICCRVPCPWSSLSSHQSVIHQNVAKTGRSSEGIQVCDRMRGKERRREKLEQNSREALAENKEGRQTSAVDHKFNFSLANTHSQPLHNEHVFSLIIGQKPTKKGRNLWPSWLRNEWLSRLETNPSVTFWRKSKMYSFNYVHRWILWLWNNLPNAEIPDQAL